MNDGTALNRDVAETFAVDEINAVHGKEDFHLKGERILST